jgi:hypothetical protein
VALSLTSINGDCANIFKCSATLQKGRKAMSYIEDQSKNLNKLLIEYFADSENRKINLKSGQAVIISMAEEDDVETVTELIHLAFEVWKKKGLDLSPMHQTLEQTQKHLVGKGLILKDSQQKIIGTISFDIAFIKTSNDKYLFYEGDQNPIPYQRNSNLNISNSRFLVFKKFAIHPNSSRIGLGLLVLKMAEQMAHDLKFEGVILETVQEANWLFDWYKNENYQTIGYYTYPSRPIETLLMLKMFKNEGSND